MPSLDGLRALSIAFVIAAHLRWFPHGLRPWFELGELGVRIFFVISGFLITRLLLDERQRSGTISLGAFYGRRAFRIIPAYSVYLIVVLVLAALHVIALRPGDLLAALTYTMNYHYDRAWYVGHTWSLSVEEQFYLLWPVLLLLAGARRGLYAAGFCLLLAPFVRMFTWDVTPDQRVGIGESFQTIFDALATGCLLAGLSDWLDRRRGYLAFLRSPWFYVTPIVAYLCHVYRDYIGWDFPFGQTLRNVSIAICIDRFVRFPVGPIGRALNYPAVAGVGRISYSLYLWQQLFLAPGGIWPALRFPLNLGLTFGAAYASYRLIELPCQRFYRQRLQARPQATPLGALAPVMAPNGLEHRALPARKTLRGLGPKVLSPPPAGRIVRVT
jgi:peptidoglycan/LPS O-acetylase OafA/YrhL